MKNPKNIFVLVCLLICSLLQADANPAEKEFNMRLPENIIPVFQQKHKGKYGIYSALVTFLALG